MVRVWIRAVTRPRLETYEALLEEAEDPSLGAAIKGMALAGFIAVAISGLWFLATVPGFRNGGVPAAVALTVYLVESLVWLLTAFLLNTVIALAVSKALRGRGSLGTQSYLLGAFSAPMSVFTSVAEIVPVLDVGLVFAGLLYSAYLHVLGLRAAHEYGWGKGILALAIAALGGAVVRACVVLALRPP